MNIWFIVGFVLGLVIFNVIAYLITGVIDRYRSKKFQEWWDDPGTEEFIYDNEGDPIWSNKKGCIGKAVSFD